ncbi:CPBP family intramembrane metalloprotease [Salinibacterium sp. NG22]|uniref:CPBP family intramembrane glutamic endopeptidase n=1 Tax=Salinibacterium sp. NG22 TaxID=2792040 RepID=UPI0018CEF445|nr:type II CAAX endopeptidase family protein [Salinibacterium sp. NG22]MBH0109165.1 CPBP family intramembrane metalloprotease [Salinibacterium sp. NG22]
MRDRPLITNPLLGRWIVLAGAALWIVSLSIVLTLSPSGTPVSSDAGAQPVAYWVILLPTAVGIGLTLLLPRPSLPRPAVVRERRPFLITTIALLVLALAFPFLAFVVPLLGEFYVLGKLVILMIVPSMLVLIWRRSVRIQWNKNSSRWWAPAIVVLVWTVLSQVAPWNPPFDITGMDRGYVVVGALATAVTAGIGEELFYRKWIQTRLEAAFGPWPAIVITSLLFALMHAGSHGTGDAVLDVARFIVLQGSFGLFLGVMWWRYRNLTAIIAIHVIVNGWAVAAALLST